jgi:hypothetical protein
MLATCIWRLLWHNMWRAVSTLGEYHMSNLWLVLYADMETHCLLKMSVNALVAYSSLPKHRYVGVSTLLSLSLYCSFLFLHLIISLSLSVYLSISPGGSGHVSREL